MADQNLRKMLEQLHEELDRTGSVDAQGRQLLHDVSVDIRELLDRSGDETLQTDDSLLERLQDAIDHLEITHPTLTMALSEIMKILNNAGI